MKYFLASFFLGLLLLLNTSAATAGNGSLYSRFGVGDIFYLPNSAAGGMGLIGIAMPSPLYINLANPALLSDIRDTRIAGNFFYRGYAASTAFGSSYQVLAGFNGVGLAIPIWRTTFSTGLYPYTNTDYTQFETGTYTTPNAGDLSYTFEYDGTGSINQVPLSLGVSVFADSLSGSLRGGGSVNFLFGNSERTTENTYGSGTTFSSSTLSELTRMYGTSVTLGTAYTSRRGVLGKSDQFSIGLTYTTPATLAAERETTIETVGVPIDTITTEKNGQVTIPESYGIGVSYSGSELYTVGADVTARNWQNFRYFNDDVSYRRNALRVSLGGQWQPSRELQAGFFSRVTYRFGVYSEQTYLRINGNDIDELGLTGGISIPLFDAFGRTESRLDINLG
ncbi:MAG: hypothetical protein IAF08_04840, partial [Rhizobacter sp.]|nr:hypothetical protein [Chlorobiales bacterium]